MKKFFQLASVLALALIVGGCALGAGHRRVQTPCQTGNEVYLGITPGLGSGKCLPPPRLRQVPIHHAPVVAHRYGVPQQPYQLVPQRGCPTCGAPGRCEHITFHNPCRGCGIFKPCEHRPPWDQVVQ